MGSLKKILSAIAVVMITASLGYSQGQDFLTFSDEVSARIELYPNPATEFLTIEIHDADLEKPVILLYNIIGNAIKIEVEKVNDDKYRIEVKDLPEGYYLVSVKDQAAKFNKTYKFIKK